MRKSHAIEKVKFVHWLVEHGLTDVAHEVSQLNPVGWDGHIRTLPYLGKIYQVYMSYTKNKYIPVARAQ